MINYKLVNKVGGELLCDVIEWDDGVVVRWCCGDVHSITIHKNIENVIKIHLNESRELIKQ